jgi:ABC-type Fe3+-hydroxamate transport system substrate-binding protein
MTILKNIKDHFKINPKIIKLVTKSVVFITSLFIFQALANNTSVTSIETVDVTSKFKIVSLSPEITHILKKLNYDKNIVAIDNSSSKLELIDTFNTNNKKVHIVSDYYSVNLEKLLYLDFDYIFVNKNVTEVKTYKIIRDTYNGQYVSDHYPICSDMVF